MSNSAVDHRVLWNQLPGLVKVELWQVITSEMVMVVHRPPARAGLQAELLNLSGVAGRSVDAPRFADPRLELGPSLLLLRNNLLPSLTHTRRAVIPQCVRAAPRCFAGCSISQTWFLNRKHKHAESQREYQSHCRAGLIPTAEHSMRVRACTSPLSGERHLRG